MLDFILVRRKEQRTRSYEPLPAAEMKEKKWYHGN